MWRDENINFSNEMYLIQKESVDLDWWWVGYDRLNGVFCAKFEQFCRVALGVQLGRTFLERLKIFTTSRGPLCLEYIRILSVTREMILIPRWSYILTWCAHVRTLECLSNSSHLPSDFLFLFITPDWVGRIVHTFTFKHIVAEQYIWYMYAGE